MRVVSIYYFSRVLAVIATFSQSVNIFAHSVGFDNLFNGKTTLNIGMLNAEQRWDFELMMYRVVCWTEYIDAQQSSHSFSRVMNEYWPLSAEFWWDTCMPRVFAISIARAPFITSINSIPASSMN